MNNQQQKNLSRGVIALIILFLVFFIGIYAGESKARKNTIVDGISISSKEFEPFWKVWNILNEKYVAATTTDTQKRIWGAIQGLASSQNDPYTVFFPPEEHQIFKSDISGNFEGVGMEIGIKDGILTVVAPLKNSPAEKAGVKAGDRIIKINDIIKKENDPETSNGDYEINYFTGKVIFNSALQPTDIVKVNYSYINGSTWTIKPIQGKKIRITECEVQFSEDINLLDTILFQLYVGGQPYGNASYYQTMYDYINESNKSYPPISRLGGSINSWRAMSAPIHIFRWDYKTTIDLSNNLLNLKYSGFG